MGVMQIYIAMGIPRLNLAAPPPGGSVVTGWCFFGKVTAPGGDMVIKHSIGLVAGGAVHRMVTVQLQALVGGRLTVEVRYSCTLDDLVLYPPRGCRTPPPGIGQGGRVALFF
jgi:hypothetical protein